MPRPLAGREHAPNNKTWLRGVACWCRFIDCRVPLYRLICVRRVVFFLYGLGWENAFCVYLYILVLKLLVVFYDISWN